MRLCGIIPDLTHYYGELGATIRASLSEGGGGRGQGRRRRTDEREREIRSVPASSCRTRDLSIDSRLDASL